MAQCIHLNFTSNQAQANKHTRFFFPWFFLLFVFFFFFFAVLEFSPPQTTTSHKKGKQKRQSDKATKRERQTIHCFVAGPPSPLPPHQPNKESPPPVFKTSRCVVCGCVCVCVCVLCVGVVCVWALCVVWAWRCVVVAADALHHHHPKTFID